jgi:hypothetical protein
LLRSGSSSLKTGKTIKMDDFKFWNFTTFHKPSLFIPNLNFFLCMQSWICQNYSLPTEYIFLGRNEEYLLRRKKRKENPRSTICIHFMDIVFHSFGPLARLKKSHFLYFLFWISLLCCTLVCNIVEGDMKIILAKSVRLKWRLLSVVFVARFLISIAAIQDKSFIFYLSFFHPMYFYTSVY